MSKKISLDFMQRIPSSSLLKAVPIAGVLFLNACVPTVQQTRAQIAGHLNVDPDSEDMSCSPDGVVQAKKDQENKVGSPISIRHINYKTRNGLSCVRVNRAKARMDMIRRLRQSKEGGIVKCVDGNGERAEGTLKTELKEQAGKEIKVTNTINESGITCGRGEVDRIALIRRQAVAKENQVQKNREMIKVRLLKKLGTTNEYRQPDGSSIVCSSDPMRSKSKVIFDLTGEKRFQMPNSEVNFTKIVSEDGIYCVRGELKKLQPNNRQVRPNANRKKPASSQTLKIGTGLSGLSNIGDSFKRGRVNKRKGIKFNPRELKRLNIKKRTIADHINSARRAASYCYGRELKNNPDLKGKVSLLIEFDGKKNVSVKIDQKETTINNTRFCNCIKAVFKRTLKVAAKDVKQPLKLEIPMIYQGN